MYLHAPAILYFNAVRKAGSIRGAARGLNVASSAVNRQILNLEAEFGGQLFERAPSGLRLTAMGEMFARHVIVVLQDFDRFKSDVQGLSGSWLGTVRIAGVEALNGSLLPEVIARHRVEAPRVTFAVQTLGSPEVQDVLSRGDADIGVAFALHRNPDLRQVALARFRMGAVVGSDSPLAKRRAVSVAACSEHTLITAGADVAVGRLLQPLFARLPVVPEPAVHTSSIELMRELAERNVGVSFQTRIGTEHLLESGRRSFRWRTAEPRYGRTWASTFAPTAPCPPSWTASSSTSYER